MFHEEGAERQSLVVFSLLFSRLATAQRFASLALSLAKIEMQAGMRKDPYALWPIVPLPPVEAHVATGVEESEVRLFWKFPAFFSAGTDGAVPGTCRLLSGLSRVHFPSSSPIHQGAASPSFQACLEGAVPPHLSRLPSVLAPVFPAYLT